MCRKDDGLRQKRGRLGETTIELDKMLRRRGSDARNLEALRLRVVLEAKCNVVLKGLQNRHHEESASES